MTAHARLGASKAHRWIQCPGSVALEASLPDETSAFAREGTAAHALAELALRAGCAPEKWVGEEIEGHFVDAAMAAHVAMYVDYINALPGEKLYEVRVDYSGYAAGGFGTADCIVLDEGVVHVVDLKFGQGVRVEAKDNAQLMLYALGAYGDFGFECKLDTARMSIVQPRLDHIDTFEIKINDLLKWARTVVKPAAKLAMQEGAPFRPSESACRFCKARATCRALAQHNLELVQATFENLDARPAPASPDLLNIDEVTRLLPHLDGFINWAGAVKDYAQSVLGHGGVVPGYMLVEGRSLRRWGDEVVAGEALAALLGEEAYLKKLISPSQAEKALGRKRAGEIADLVVKPVGKPTLAPAADPRPELSGSGVFNDLSGDE